jgi:YidC/Oxa1 family membrane protein insertase
MRKIVALIGITLGLIALGACTQEAEIKRVIVNAPVNMVYTEASLQTGGYTFKGVNGLEYFTIDSMGVVSKTSFEGSIIEPSSKSGVLEYNFIFNDTQHPFKIYARPNDQDLTDDSIVLVNFRFIEKNVRTSIGATESLDGILVYVIRANHGSIEDIEIYSYEEAVEAGAVFSNNNYKPLQENGFVSNIDFTITFTFEDYETSFKVYTAGGEKPIHSQDASFFDWILVVPVAFITQFFAGLFNNSFAIGILITTIIVRTLAWPIYSKSNDMSLKMNLAQPEMQRVQAKYATKKDPQSQQQMQAEMMGVYKKYGISTLGCLFPFLQMPIFIAMYGVVRRITIPGGMYTDKVSNTFFLGIDLAASNSWFIAGFLAAIVGATMFALQLLAQKKPSYAKNTGTQNITPQAAQTQKTMKYVTYFMVFMMMSISYQSQALALYWVFGNAYSITQTLINRKVSEKKHETLKQKELLGGLIDAKKN